MIVNHYEKSDNKKFGGPKRFPTKSRSTTSKISSVGNSKKDEGKCINSGGIDHFAQDCKVKKNNSKEESYETKYKHLVASCKGKIWSPKFMSLKVKNGLMKRNHLMKK